MLRSFGAAHAIPLQVLAVLLAGVQIVVYVPFLFYVLNKLDDLSMLAGLGPLSWFPWLLACGALVTDALLWIILRVMDADLNERNL